MTREALTAYILETYDTTVYHTWNHSPSYEVFRHRGNCSWFAMMANVPRKVVPNSQSGRDLVPIVNLKCDPVLIDSLLEEPGFYPAYHMKKGNWITVDIEAVDDERIKSLVDMSFNATATQISWGLTPFKSIADAQAMDRQYDGSWGTDLVGYGRLAAVAKDGQG